MPASRTDHIAGRLRQAHAEALGALDAATAQAAAVFQDAERAATARFERQAAIIRKHSDRRAEQCADSARDLGTALTADREGAVAAADFITIGMLSLPAADGGRTGTPCVLPLLGRGNIVLDVTGDHETGLIRHIVAETYSGTAPGQVDVIGFDPLLAGVLSPFAGIKAAAESALTVLYRPAELSELVDRLAGDVQRVNDVLRGTCDDLLAYREHTGHPVERLQLVVLADAPAGIDEQTFHQLLSLMKVGPVAGISFLWSIRPGSDTPDWWDRAAIDAAAQVLSAGQDALRWQAHPQFRLELHQRTASEIVATADRLATRISDAVAPSVAFEQVQPLDRRWQESSAEGITFAIGTAGRRTIEVTLGDERQQRHNALVTGAVGQGKSNLLLVVVHSLCQRYAPDELAFYMLDFKAGVTLFPFASTPGSLDYLPHARVLGLESDREFGVAVLEHLEAELGRRARLFRPYGDDIAKYRAAVPEAIMPRIVLIIDEFQMMFDPVDNNAERAAHLLEGLARRGRSCGVHIILASQTISGIAALMSRENGIFAQFPVRIALKNSVGESFASLMQGNAAAAQLRMRGEAILNLDYGIPTANQHTTIAVADQEVLAQVRKDWWEAARNSATPPQVFDGTEPVRAGVAAPAITAMRSRVAAGAAAPAALVGYPIEVSRTPLAIPLSDDPGRNIVVLGAGEKGGQDDAGVAVNNAIGILQTAAVSLALQHPDSDAEFICFDLLDEATARRNNHTEWLSLMQQLGCRVHVVGKGEVATRLQTIADGLADREPRRRSYLIAFGLDRAPDLEIPDMFAHTRAEDLRTILRDGPSRGVHVIGWWSNAATFKSHIGFGGDGFVECLIVLRLDQSTTQEFLGPFVTWSVRDNRGLVSDRTQLAEPTTVVPFAPLTEDDSRLLLDASREA
ncbi:FtsK/SpoIIIE domain-containing protein [Nocardia higoensis]|uniref:FtsK/SpoIIIE domain-containing protein n=1 Tax=Nocardia higoensis TaxID=228599 RepID=UPI00030A9BBA|nr:FtsK/SpoIIIE domain-containing protein [Nocardia higoensis]